MFTKGLIVATALLGSAITAPIPGLFWTVKEFTRVCDTYTHSCTYTFNISPGGYTPDFSCSITNTSPAYSDPRTESWFSYSCNGDISKDDGWVISWGYNPAYDSAVMTVLNRDSQEDAWFGWNNVNTVTGLADVGPNPVYKTGTF